MTKYRTIIAIGSVSLSVFGTGLASNAFASDICDSESPATCAFKTPESTSRFLARATFGPTQDDISDLIGTSPSAWFSDQLGKPVTSYYAPIKADYDICCANGVRPHQRREQVYDVFVNNTISAEDQLRQRMAFALSQIFVLSAEGGVGARPTTTSAYLDIISNNAFGNYRDLLEEVTYSPAMAMYLTYYSNEKGDGTRVPDENYAREILQLFSIGLHKLNLDGTPAVNSDGKLQETYTNADITELAKVFTGLSSNVGGFFQNNDLIARTEPLKIFPCYHALGEKNLDFLADGLVIPAASEPSNWNNCNSNTTNEDVVDYAEKNIDRTLDAIFNHPNVAPFFSHQLIQRFVTSSPKPGYVERVASAFETGSYDLPDGTTVGAGVRGDLKATLAAVIFDKNAIRQSGPKTFGKVREPYLRITNFARAFKETTPDAAEFQPWRKNLREMGQLPMASPSVFNFFRPGYVAPNTATGEHLNIGITAPELQITNEATTLEYINEIENYVFETHFNYGDNGDGGLRPDYSYEISIADDPAALIEHLDTLLAGGRLRAEKTRIAQVIEPITDLESRVKYAVFMTMTSNGYLVQR